MRAIIELQNLHTGYRSGKELKPITRGIHAQLFKGELVCLLGPNGAGKSTLMRTISGSQKPLEGKVLLDQKDVYSIPAKQLAKQLSVVLTERIQVGMLTAYEVVALGRFPYTNWEGKLREKDHQVIQEAIVMAGAEELADRPISELSDGERQKIMVARAFAQEPEVMILDEVTAFLDLPRRVEVMRVLRRMAKESGKSILLSTHDMDLALRGADKIWLLPKGGSLKMGAPEDLVLNGSFQSAFQAEGIHFDRQSGSFKIQHTSSFSVRMKDDGDIAHWTKRALERSGIAVSQSAEALITIESEKENTIWRLVNGPNEKQLHSIYDLVNELKQDESDDFELNT